MHARASFFPSQHLHVLLSMIEEPKITLCSVSLEQNGDKLFNAATYFVDPSQPDEKGRNALHYAVECGDESVVKELLKDEKLE